MRHKRTAAVLVALSVMAAGSALAIAQSQRRTLDSISVLKTGKAVEPAAGERGMLKSEQASLYRLELARARVAADGDEAAGKGGLTGRWLVVPGRDGLCLVPGGPSMTCAPVGAVADGKLAMTTLPIPDEPAVPGRAPSVGSGPGKVQGVAPDGITHVVGLDGSDEEIARTAVVNNVYELDLGSFRELGDVGLVTAEGEIATRLPLGPNR